MVTLGSIKMSRIGRLIYSFMQQIFIQQLAYARHDFGYWSYIGEQIIKTSSTWGASVLVKGERE